MTAAVPAIYRCTVVHSRSTTVTRRFQYSTYYWLVDVDELPRLPRWLRPFARFSAGDHLGDPNRTLSANIRSYLDEQSVRADRILLLTCARVAGHVFNPLSVYYCYDGDEQVAVVAEVHNTYGGRHVYLLHPDEHFAADVEKRFYVSPFLPMGGRYVMRTPPPGRRVQVSVTLHAGPRTPFVATLNGRGGPATSRAVLAALLRWPLVTLRTAALIRWQGVRLWARGVPVQPRPADATELENAR